ncbi:hypothetical protein UNDKW_4325 [Undibacterium sp. KW1]|uniref:methyl-accepting chemotaxis protein n=1 Tax=Undibacterium sp. KW1 TaxID=2058624 RepID=UPI001331E5E3|nr:methyl-accepting chemotaxis protein [Undibacterium sp. KW1]BBB62598.1 hypothetical protein UNDKW_4325 [Undibacterium sp. KW1]
MSNIVRASAELKQFLAAPAAKPKYDSAFAAHGFWTMGVVLMRNLRFKSKAAVICLMFLIPMSLVSWNYVNQTLENISFSAKERQGVEYNQIVFQMIDYAQQLRRDSGLAIANAGAAATVEATKEKLKVLQAKLAEAEKKYGADFGSAKAFAQVQAAYAETASAKTADEVLLVHGKHIKALLELMGLVTDGSKLTLDPEVASFYMMDASLGHMPQVIDQTGLLGGKGIATLQRGNVSPKQSVELISLHAVAANEFEGLQEALGKAVVADPALAKQVDTKKISSDISSFITVFEKNFVETQNFSPEFQIAFVSHANKALEEQHQLAGHMLAELDEILANRIAGMKNALYTGFGLFIFFMLLAAYFFYSFFLVTRGGLQTIQKHLNEMSVGDLRVSPAVPWGKDETADVIIDLRRTYNALHELIRTVRHSARALHHTSSEISSASLDLSSRSENAAASLEEQAAAIEEIGSTVNNTTDKALMAARFAADNANVAEEGGKVIVDVVDTMHNIHASSSKISDIISVIDGIAFQTNILALNAAVEAARAGESGRGFAVVASEVRSLAHRSADAAKEIKSLISNSVDQINSGTVVVEKAGATMNTMVNNARQINSYLTEIASASKEQATGVSQVATAINELDEHTQQNAALVEETAAAAGALTQQAETLQSEIANFIVA